MENQQQTTTLCRAGCGFFGSPATEGLCSKCFKDQIKRKQDTARLSPPILAPPVISGVSGVSGISGVSVLGTSGVSGSGSVNPGDVTNPPVQQLSSDSTSPSPTTSSMVISSDKVRDQVSCSQAAKSSEEVTAQLESAVAAASAQVEAAASSSGGLSNSSSVTSLEAADGKEGSDMAPAPKKPNRCHVCKKRVGLTGFVCRCGGLYCGEHRYDSAHGCSFDYKTMEREELRKNNPVIVSEKIQRI